MIHFFKKKLNPEAYQGENNNSLHFEGWYFKIIDINSLNAYAVIPGIFISKDNSKSHSFIQIFDGINNKSHYFKFPIEDFHSDDFKFRIKINSNYFSPDKIILDLRKSSFSIYGELLFSDLTQWPKSLISPGIMGWYSWVPFMECYHGIISLNHKINGSLSINEEKVDFSDGLGYTEKDWGRSFPKSWIWCQSNHFSSSNVSFTGSIAIIPWIRNSFLGFIFGLWLDGKLYKFATYTGAKLIDLNILEDKVTFTIKQKKITLEVTAYQSECGYLHAPTINGMNHVISETLKSTIDVKLTKDSENDSIVIFQGKGVNAGFEIGGDINSLLQMYQKSIKI